jgi:hypothetical protein
MGKPLSQARGEVKGMADRARGVIEVHRTPALCVCMWGEDALRPGEHAAAVAAAAAAAC